MRELSQPNQFAAEEVLTLRGPKGVIERVRIVGPFRKETQIELAVSDCRKLGINPFFAISGNLSGSPGLTISGNDGSLSLSSGVIVPMPHIHMNPETAQKFNLSHLDKVSVTVEGSRPLTFHEVVIRSRNYIDDNAFHIDTDQSNALGDIGKAKIVSILKKAILDP